MGQDNKGIDDHEVVASVIMPVYNCAATIAAQFDALRGQDTDVSWEIVVVDDGSTDDTVSLIESYRQTMPGLRLTRAPQRRGIAYARNVGVANARGRILLFCDADDIVAPGWLAAMIRALGRHDFVVGRVEVGALNSGVTEKYGNNGLRDSLLNFLPYAIGCNLGITRRAFESVGGFSTRYRRCSDVELSWRLQLAGYSLHEVPEAEIYYRYRTTAWSHWKAAFAFSQAHTALYKDFAVHGAKRSPAKDVLTRYKNIFRGVPRWKKMSQRNRIGWAFNVGVTLGRLWGSLRFRTLYF